MAVKREFEPKFKRGEHDVRELLRVYLVTDEALCVHHDLLDIVQMAVRAGVTCVQLREKHLSTGAFVAKARALKELLNRYAPGDGEVRGEDRRRRHRRRTPPRRCRAA